MARWLDPQPVDVPPALREAIGGHPLVAETLARRGMNSTDAARAFLNPLAFIPAAAQELPDVDIAVERLRRAIREGEPIAIWGDFDADGQAATALLLEGLGSLGANVTFGVPTRREGHGLQLGRIEQLIAGGVRLLVTCDTGATAHVAVARASALGTDVIITDHHPPVSESSALPPALAIINPHRLPPGHSMATLTGVGVAYELVRALDPALADRSLDLVALGTIADVGTLTGDSRYLVQRGLEVLRHAGRPGLQAVYAAADLRPDGITEEHVGFYLGPRLNALGRLGDAARGVELLTTSDWTNARILASEAEGLNSQRQWLSKQVTEAALAQIGRQPELLSDYYALVLSHPTWPAGVVGVVATRLAERFGKPAVLIATPAGEPARGSGRSVPGLDLSAALAECASLLTSFGGHAGAVGLSLDAGRIPELRSALSRAVEPRLKALAEPALRVDAYVELSDLTLELVTDLGRLAPFGAGNPAPILAIRDVRVLSDATIGRTGEHRRLTVEDAQDHTQTVFWWNGADQEDLPKNRFDLAATLRASDYRGMAEVQVEWIGAREIASAPGEAESEAAARMRSLPPIEVVDYRGTKDPEGTLRTLAARGDLQIWAEGNGPPGFEVLGRHQLVHADRLAIWTLPPGPQELKAALAQVRPLQVLLFDHDPGGSAADAGRILLARLAGLVRFALQARAGRLDLPIAASLTAQRISTVQAGLELLAAQEQVVIADRNPDSWQLKPPEPAGAGDSLRGTQAQEAAWARLQALLAETAAYRSYLRSAPADVFTQA